jgi:hypothetical protein
VSFNALEYDDSASPPTLSGLKDTIYVPPGATLRLLDRLGDYPDCRNGVHVPLPKTLDRGPC